MHTPWVPERQLRDSLQRNEAFWRGELSEGPLLWVTVPGARPGTPPAAPATDEEQWTDVQYQIEKTEDALSRAYFAADALPIHNPWLGPDQFAAWLGGGLMFRTKDNTSWTAPFVEDWADFPELSIDPGNRWWRIYLEILRASVDRGRGRWVTTYPDLHSGIDGLAAIRGTERLMIDLVENPDPVKRAMRQMTKVWKQIVDKVSGIVLPGGQGTTNWTSGWSEGRFVCVGQNDFSCLPHGIHAGHSPGALRGRYRGRLRHRADPHPHLHAPPPGGHDHRPHSSGDRGVERPSDPARHVHQR